MLKHLNLSLRITAAASTALPIILILSLLSITQYIQVQQMFQQQTELIARQIGDITFSSLRHAMVENDTHMVNEIILNIKADDSVRQIQIYDLDGMVRLSSQPENVGEVGTQSGIGCIECHQYEPEERPRTARLTEEAGILRILVPIVNEPDCQVCHTSAEQSDHIGVLLIDISVIEIEAQARRDLWFNLWMSLGSGVLIGLITYWLVDRVVVRRILAFRDPITRFAAGDFSTRVNSTSSLTDEITELSQVLNQMAEQIEQFIVEEQSRSELRHQSIIKERERIARELHDGAGQLLAYLNTKVTTVHFLLEKEQHAPAMQQLQELEKAVERLFIDLRITIIGLRMTGEDIDLETWVGEYARQFQKLSGIQVETHNVSGLMALALSNEHQAHLQRIIQEALTNVFKHAAATQVTITVSRENGQLDLLIKDNGSGFDQAGGSPEQWDHYGMKSMRERAAIINSIISWDSSPGEGTTVNILFSEIEEKNDSPRRSSR